MNKSISSNAEDSLNCTVKNERNLNVLSLNCCGVKLRLQYPEFCELIKKNDIVCLQETKTDDIDKIDLEGYTFKMKNRKKIGRISGGIILGYKDHLRYSLNYLLHYYYYYMSWNYVVRTDHQ
jgi:hypothetical protein